MKVSGTVLNAMVDGQFLGSVTSKTYSLILIWDGATSESDPETITFVAAGDGALADGVTQMSSSVFYAVAAGTTVQGLKVVDDSSNILIEEGFADEEYTDNGTFTVNNIVITVAGT